MSVIRWLFNTSKWLPSDEEFESLLRLLPQDDQERIRRFYFREDAKRCLIGKLLTRHYLVTELGLREYVISTTEEGKPYLKSPSLNINFNVSHDKSWVAFVAASYPIGVDLMQVALLPNLSHAEFLESLADIFSAEEWKRIRKGSEAEQLHKLYVYFCLKECYGKALGLGLGEIAEFGAIHHPEGDTENVTLLYDHPRPGWCFELRYLENDYFVAIARRPPSDKRAAEKGKNQGTKQEVKQEFIKDTEPFREISIEEMKRSLLNHSS
ncbi:uncharacterized protein VTP21DRAFT_2216 [Calcarisporiella thermophila]|uniref:uncharacterized protein n=1 Tax=Calcarisporiella thermophila TaxID=911321 RepID=UPI003742E4AF